MNAEPGGCQLKGQATNLTFESACRLLYTEHSHIAICILLSDKADTRSLSLGGWKAELT